MAQEMRAAKIEKLLVAMSLEEKLGQLTMIRPHEDPNFTASEVRRGRAGSILDLSGRAAVRDLQEVAVKETRLGIPLLFALDVLHGYETIFPIPLAEAAAMDPTLWEATARAAAGEAAADGIALTFAPMLDVSRDPRWGRMAESPGEDPWLASRFAEAKIAGFQGRSLSASASVATTAKHFAGYGAVTAGREYGSIDVSNRTLHEVYLPPFQAAIREEAAAIMPALSDLAGVPLTAHRGILRDLLRGRYGFHGVIISDFNAIAELISHGVAGDLAEAAALALKAGVDIDMASGAYLAGLPGALERGLVGEADIDEALMRVLTLKAKLGLLDEPFARGTALAPQLREKNRTLAREAARKSIVLLKNSGGVLPLAGPSRRLLVAGGLANAAGEMLGPWHAAGNPKAAVSFLAGLRTALPDWDISHFDDFSEPEAQAAATKSSVLLLCLGETANMCGEATSRAEPCLPGAQSKLLADASAFGKPLIAVLTCGRPLMSEPLFEKAGAILVAWFLGSEAGNAVADILIGKANPSGKLPVSWPAAAGQIPIFYAQRPTGRRAGSARETSKYIDVPVTPRFPFGYGLSYTRFSYSGLRVLSPIVTPDSGISIEATVTNEGPVAGEETCFLYIRGLISSIARPVLELRGVAKIMLGPGESGTVRFGLEAAALAILDSDGNARLEAGKFEILVGPNADPETLIRQTICLTGQRPVGARWS